VEVLGVHLALGLAHDVFDGDSVASDLAVLHTVLDARGSAVANVANVVVLLLRWLIGWGVCCCCWLEDCERLVGC
jgi:hypothetical protein